MATQQQEEEEQKRKLELELELELENHQDEEHKQQELSLSVCSDSVDLDNTNNDDQNKNNMNNNNKTGRLPRWTRQEILVLIKGKKVAENRVLRGRTAAAAALSNCCVEPKWATVSSYCLRHGVNRGAVQCRKRWSNLAADFKKIKDWESHYDSSDSYWLMRNDLRRERKLPGFFDKQVYDILDGNMDLQPPPPDSPPPPPPPPPPLPPLLFDSCRPTPADDALFSDIDTQQQLHPAVPISIPAPTPISGAADEEKQAEVESTSQAEGERQRKRHVMEDEKEGETRSLLQVMEKNGRMLSAQLEAQNINLKLDRDDRKDHADSLVAVLNKLADAFARIADKL